MSPSYAIQKTKVNDYTEAQKTWEKVSTLENGEFPANSPFFFFLNI
jgi:hypothetical protein